MEFVKCVLVVLTSVFCRSSSSPSVTLSCPTKWTDGAKYVLTCHLQVSSYTNDTCQYFPDLLQFHFQAPRESQSILQCTVSHLTTRTDTCAGHYLPKGCRCKEIRDGQYVLEQVVTADRESQEGGIWSCVPVCNDNTLINPFLQSPSASALKCRVAFEESTPPERLPPQQSIPTTTTRTTSSSVIYVTSSMTSFVSAVLSMLLSQLVLIDDSQ